MLYLGNTKSREMNVFAEANPARCHWRWASCSMACLFTRMAVELRTGLSDALILILQRFLTLRFVESSILHDSYFCHTLMEPSGPW